MQGAQRLAAIALRQVLAGRTLPVALAQAVPGVNPERPLIQELSYGSVRFLGELRAILRQLVPDRLPDPDIEALLLVALYQLVHTSAPAHAVVDQAVRASIGVRRGAARGLVNAVLRSFLRRRDALLAGAAATDEGRFSYPRWWIDRIRTEYPADWQSILDAGNARPPLTLRINRRVVASRDGYLAQLAAAGIAAAPIGTAGVILAKASDVRALPGFADGAFSVQDHGAQHAASLLGPADGMRVLDACAAPGGKTTHLLELAAVDVLALDCDEARLARVDDNLARLRLKATTRVADAADPAAWWDGKPFDRILADVPCSASGVVRRHPDGKWLRREADVEAFALQQDRLLEALWPCLAAGGRLLYATCSLFRRENEERIEAFLARHADAAHTVTAWPDGAPARGGQLLPCGGGAEHNHDGFFYALLSKTRLSLP